MHAVSCEHVRRQSVHQFEQKRVLRTSGGHVGLSPPKRFECDLKIEILFKTQVCRPVRVHSTDFSRGDVLESA